MSLSEVRVAFAAAIYGSFNGVLALASNQKQEAVAKGKENVNAV